MEREPGGENQELGKLYSSLGDVIPIDQDVRIVLFGSGDVPPCIEITKQTEGWYETQYIFTDDVHVLGQLAQSGIETYSQASPFIDHVDEFTSPDNDSSAATWEVALSPDLNDETQDEYDDQVGSALDVETELPLVETPAIRLTLDGDEILLTWENTHVKCFYSDPTMTHAEICLEDEESTYYLPLFVGDWGEDFIEALVENNYPVSYYPVPNKSVMDVYRMRAHTIMEQDPWKLLENEEAD